MKRSLETILAPPPAHMVGDGFKVHNFIPGTPQMSMVRMSPFIMLDYNAKTNLEPTDQPRGVGVHPHRGFETVTISFHGSIAHHDSAGNSGIIHPGDVQWMTAGSGVLHKEYHEENFSAKGGDFQMVQLWVNLPSKDKMNSPKYQEIEQGGMAKFEIPNDGGVVDVIAGSHQNINGNAETHTPIHMFVAHLNEGGKETFRLPQHFNTLLLVAEGEVKVNEISTVRANHVGLFKNDGDSFELEATENSKVLILSGEPLDEPIAAHGPFVMNTREELIAAFEDFQAGKFGTLK